MEDNENDHNRDKNRSPSPGVKSKAVVKYVAVQSPSGYALLQCNTDLNLPPSNWSSAVDSYGLKQILTQSSGLSRMAHMFPDSVGSVDVIAGAECIKKLLKLPYQPNGTVSMMVHRVENTLLLDDFGIYDYLMKSEWTWLKDFFCENIMKTMSEQDMIQNEKTNMIQKQASSAVQLTSKFLCHSVASLPAEDQAVGVCQPAATPMLEGPHLPEPETRSEGPREDHLYNRNVSWTFEDIQMLIGSDLPIFGGKDRPCVSLKLIDAREPINVLTGIDYWLDNLMCNVPEVLMCYHIDGIVQRYEPLKTEDLPNLDGSKFSPKVIRNVAQNILSFLKSNATKAGHTYWLFKGAHDEVVKLYDLTSLCGGLGVSEGVENPFTTPVAMLLYRVARNMRMTNRMKHVKELLENAIKLLSEERHPQIVASSHYMLADLYVPAATNPACPDFKEKTSEDSDGEDQDPSFHENMDPEWSQHNWPYYDQESPSQSADERTLGDSEGTTANVASERDGDTAQLALQMGGLALHDIGKAIQPSCKEQKYDLKAAPVLGTDPPRRCGKALQHALKGLLALHHITITKSQDEERERLKEQIILEEQNPKMANPFKPIKMNYQPLTTKRRDKQPKEHVSRTKRRKRERKNTEPTYAIDTSNVDKNAIMIRRENNIFQSWYEPNRDDNFAWKLHLKTLLYEKICLVYAILAEYSYTNGQYGFCLKYIELASKAQKLLHNMIIKSHVVDSTCLLGRVGDNYFQIYKHWSPASVAQFKKQFEIYHETDRLLKAEIEKDMTEEVMSLAAGEEFNLDIRLPESDIDAILLSCEYYRRGIAVTEGEKKNELLRRLGSTNNELGVRYMNDAQSIFINYSQRSREENPPADTLKMLLAQFNQMSEDASKCLTEAADIFQSVNDIPNLALLYCNKGRFMRFKAHCNINSVGFNSQFRSLYNSAEELYRTALRLVAAGDSEAARAVSELVAWELSSHTYKRATLMQDHPTDSFNEANEVAEALKHALKYCNLSAGPKQLVYQFRAATISYRLASLYHSLYRTCDDEGPRRRRQYTQARTYYEQAAALFAVNEESRRYLTAQLEHVALHETHADNTTNLKLKSLQTALQIIRQCHSMIKYIKERDPKENREVSKTEDQGDFKDDRDLLSLLESRLHHILKNIIQYCRSKSNKDYEKMTEMYKRLYSVCLRISKAEDLQTYAASICDVFDKMDAIVEEYE